VSKQALYLGRAGQLAVMSEFIVRGYNGAAPEVDVGEDVFVLRDRDATVSRIQVKAASGRRLERAALAAQFNLRYDQLSTPIRPELHYVFVVREADRWVEMVIIPRRKLYDLHKTGGVGTHDVRRGRLVLNVRWTPTDVRCGGHDLSSYRNNWSAWPPIRH
jgi:hypothetical protein